jgi:hypothetical protein
MKIMKILNNINIFIQLYNIIMQIEYLHALIN